MTEPADADARALPTAHRFEAQAGDDAPSQRRGQLRIYLGAAPGVGKTFAMLGEGHRRLRAAPTWSSAFVETHGRRAHRRARSSGLEVAAARTSSTYRGSVFEEMDLDAVLARHPQIALVDELAHTNVPGSRNAKRWQDVEELLDAGIDVITTVNIQHLESLNDVVKKITGVPQRETVPDEVVRARRPGRARRHDAGGAAPPDGARQRLPGREDRRGADQLLPAGNLTALRELALLWLADRVDEGLQRYREAHDIHGTWEARERVVVALTGGPEGETLIRRAARIAARSAGGDLLAVHVDQVGRPDRRRPGRAGRPAAARRVARRQLPPGRRRRRARRAARLRPGRERHPARARRQPPRLAQRAADRARRRACGRSASSGDIDVHIVTHARWAAAAGCCRPSAAGCPLPRQVAGYALAVAARAAALARAREPAWRAQPDQRRAAVPGRRDRASRWSAGWCPRCSRPSPARCCSTTTSRRRSTRSRSPSRTTRSRSAVFCRRGRRR